MKSIIMVIHDPVLADFTKKILNDSFQTLHFINMRLALDYLYHSLPDLIIIDLREEDQESLVLLAELKDDPIFRQLPVLAVIPDHTTVMDWKDFFIEDYIRDSYREQEMLERIYLSLKRTERIVESNPLTRLPGNISINRRIQEQLDLGYLFALAYTDLDHFKPFNDRYGFSRGDEVIRITGRLITNAVKQLQPQGSFVGHIGGDDFVYIMEPLLAEKAAKNIIDAFDRIIPTFYDNADRLKGYIQSFDRNDNISRFPIMTISIGLADTSSRKYEHYGALTEVLSEVKHFAKQCQASCYRWDKRRGNPAGDGMDQK